MKKICKKCGNENMEDAYPGVTFGGIESYVPGKNFGEKKAHIYKCKNCEEIAH
jgi:hypothetical protein